MVAVNSCNCDTVVTVETVPTIHAGDGGAVVGRAWVVAECADHWRCASAEPSELRGHLLQREENRILLRFKVGGDQACISGGGK